MGIKNSKLFGGKKVADKSIYQYGYNPCYQVEPVISSSSSINQIPDLPPSPLIKPPEIVISPPPPVDIGEISESSEDSEIIMMPPEDGYHQNPAYKNDS